jgi:hypothetical protein
MPTPKAKGTSPLNIKDPEAYRLASLIAEHTGKTLTRVVLDALRHEKARILPRKWDGEKIASILAKAHALPDRDRRPVREIENDLYNEQGLIK